MLQGWKNKGFNWYDRMTVQKEGKQRSQMDALDEVDRLLDGLDPVELVPGAPERAVQDTVERVPGAPKRVVQDASFAMDLLAQDNVSHSKTEHGPMTDYANHQAPSPPPFIILHSSPEKCFLRLVIIATRKRNHGHTSPDVQLSQITFFDGTAQLPVLSVENPGGSNPMSEGPGNLVDGSMDTKWFDHNARPLVCQLHGCWKLEGYSFATANDYDGRDPVRWRLDGSRDGREWIVLDDRSCVDQDVPKVRKRFLDAMRLPVPWRPHETCVHEPPSLLSNLPPGWTAHEDLSRGGRSYFLNRVAGHAQ